MLAVALTVLRPVVGDAVMSVAEDNPAALQLPFVKDIVAENLGPALTQPVSTEPTQVQFLVEKGDTAKTIALKLEDEDLIGDSRAFVYLAVVNDLTRGLQQGTFVLRKNMTPDQLVNALLAPPEVKYVDIGLRTGLRLEQITAKLQSLHPELLMDASEFYDIVKSPPAELLADYPWLTKKLTAGRPISPERYVAIRLVRRVDETKNRLIRVDERDVYCELAVFLNKLFGAIERIDNEEVSSDLRNVACSQAFLRDDGDLGEKLRKRVENEIFRRMIRICYGRLIRFVTGIRV